MNRTRRHSSACRAQWQEVWENTQQCRHTPTCSRTALWKQARLLLGKHNQSCFGCLFACLPVCLRQWSQIPAPLVPRTSSSCPNANSSFRRGVKPSDSNAEAASSSSTTRI